MFPTSSIPPPGPIDSISEKFLDSFYMVAKIPRLTTPPTLRTVPGCGMGATAGYPNTYSEIFLFWWCGVLSQAIVQAGLELIAILPQLPSIGITGVHHYTCFLKEFFIFLFLDANSILSCKQSPI